MPQAYDEIENSQAEKLREELPRYVALFEAAFAELHHAVVAQARKPNQYISPFHDYPMMSFSGSGFPLFNDVGFHRDHAPKDYVGLVRPRGLKGILGGLGLTETSLQKGTELTSFLRTSEIGKRLNLGVLFDRPANDLVAGAVERYLCTHGLDASIDPTRRDAVIWPLIFGTINEPLPVRLVVPITMTHFEVDHFRLNASSYVTRIPRKLQLARARISSLGSGAVKMVVGAATHAFVSTGWTVDVNSIDEVQGSLGQVSSHVLDAIDSFFGALRVATGLNTGYAQILWMPKGWALDYYCDLPPIYGATLRRYPNNFDDYGWVKEGATVTTEELSEARHIYESLLNSESEAIRLALNRLNACLTRDDAADAILDGTIGLEVLLGDDQNQSLSYKLRLRAAALAMHRGDTAYPPSEIAMKVKRLYEARSAIVHGRRKKRSKRATEPADDRNSKDRLIASDLLSFVLKVLLDNPQYQEPIKIDEGLLLRGDAIEPEPRKMPAQ
ncbi:HEPN domain-containing protein [Bradyrhizobium sp. SZCCHNRI3052]|uniref:HEPN domain-containing protein n=1 Tax=Bradyrhizobium sp. SZCCHNRI3052 TaxID=3057295 RepID=UPI002916253E|nr:HEPN domain-containing protein [Bradyrhizobium sp. SZCCHNRI3052]